MKHSISCLIAFLFIVSAFAQTPVPQDLKTLSGKTYKQARVFRVEPDGINYMFAGGMVKIPFTNLPEAIRKQYGYDPARAAKFAAEDAKAQEDAQAGVQSDLAAVNERKKQDQIAAAQDLDAVPKPVGIGGSTALQTGSLGDAAVTKTPVDGTVIQVLESGLLVASKKNHVVLLQDYPNQDAVVEDSLCRAIGELRGSFEYDRANNTTGTVPRYHFISGTIIGPREK